MDNRYLASGPGFGLAPLYSSASRRPGLTPDNRTLRFQSSLEHTRHHVATAYVRARRVSGVSRT